MNPEIINIVGVLASLTSLILAVMFYIMAKKQSDKANKSIEKSNNNIIKILLNFEEEIDSKIVEIQNISKITAKRLGASHKNKQKDILVHNEYDDRILRVIKYLELTHDNIYTVRFSSFFSKDVLNSYVKQGILDKDFRLKK